jgi:H+/Cl- antiporter ClcA
MKRTEESTSIDTKGFSLSAISLSKNSVFVSFVFLAAIISGIVAAVYNEAFILGTKIARDRFFHNPGAVFIITPLFFLTSAWLCRQFSPNAAGGGTDHVVSAIQKLSHAKKNAEDVSEYLSFKVVVIKVLSSIISITGGGAIGREGPIIQISASIFAMIAQKTKKALPHFDLRTWIIAGSAAGLAAAFNTPLAGIIFAIEELAQFHIEKQFYEFKTKAFFAVIIAGVTAQFISGSYILFEFSPVGFLWQANSVLVLLFVAVICGLGAMALRKFTETASGWRNNAKGGIWYLFPIITGIIVATVSFYLGERTFGAGAFTIQEILKSPLETVNIQDFLGRFVNVVASYASGCAGGLLLPAMALGASIGSMIGKLAPMMDSRVFAASGMGAFLGALINAPLTAAVLVLEVTNQRELVFPLFLATIVASCVYNNLLKLEA